MLATQTRDRRTDAVVVGGGLCGLIAATKLAKSGRSVILLEQSKHLGGRAVTTLDAGIHFNLGPRALYRQGHAFRLLTELGVTFNGRIPNPGVSLGYYQGGEYRLPTTLTDLLVTRLLTVREKWQLAGLLRKLPRLDTPSLQDVSVQRWVGQHYGSGALGNLLYALFRVTSYAADMDSYSAGAALDQLRTGLVGNVLYIDGGWQTLVDRLHDVAVQNGVAISSASRVVSADAENDGVIIHLANQETILATTAVLAVAPQSVQSLLDLPDDHLISLWRQSARPVRAACLDIALTCLTRPAHRFALGIDQPHYFSVHSAAARLAPEGVAVIHAMKYLRDSEPAALVESELEELLDRAQPGWRKHVVARRLLPSMLVAHDLPQASSRGLAGRPAVEVAGRPGVFVAGDWIGHRGQIADASAASAEEAANRALQFIANHAPSHWQHV